MKKTLKIIIPILFLCIISFVSCKKQPVANNQTKSNFNISNLKIDQQNAYIALSANDMEGYNRWVPFYFSFSEKSDTKATEIENLLNKKITSVTLYSDDKNIYQTKQLIWSAFKLGDGKYNLTLVLVPELTEFKFDGIQTITHIELGYNSNSSKKYELPTYLIEQRPTISENALYVSLSSTETDIGEDLTANAEYGIAKNKNKITDFALDYPQTFSDIKDYKINTTKETKDNTIEYSITYQLGKKCSKTIFRPFLKIKYNDGQSGWLIPSVPVYFK